MPSNCRLSSSTCCTSRDLGICSRCPTHGNCDGLGMSTIWAAIYRFINEGLPKARLLRHCPNITRERLIYSYVPSPLAGEGQGEGRFKGKIYDRPSPKPLSRKGRGN